MCFGCVDGDDMSQIGCVTQVLFEKQVIALKGVRRGLGCLIIKKIFKINEIINFH